VASVPRACEVIAGDAFIVVTRVAMEVLIY
jgi:hypothetical protein